MNPNAQQYRVRPCIVCGFPFSDEHHIHPEILGRENSPTVNLCPNHHRLAHIVQGMIVSDYFESSILSFAESTFDSSFNKTALPILLSAYKDLSGKLFSNSNSGLIKGSLVRVCVTCTCSSDPDTKEHNYWWATIKIVGILSSIVYVPLLNTEFEVWHRDMKIIDMTPNQVKKQRKIIERISRLIRCNVEDIVWVLLEILSSQMDCTDVQLKLLETAEQIYRIQVTEN